MVFNDDPNLGDPNLVTKGDDGSVELRRDDPEFGDKESTGAGISTLRVVPGMQVTNDDTSDQGILTDKSDKVAKPDSNEYDWIWYVISLAMTTMGIGLLTIPGAFAEAGYVWGTLCIVVCGILTDICLSILVMMSNRSETDNYEDNAERYLGPLGGKIVKYVVTFDLYLSIVSLINIFAKSFGERPEVQGDKNGLLREWFGCTKPDDCPHLCMALVGFLGLVVIFPALLMKSVHSIRHVSTVALACLFTAVGILIGIYFYAAGNGVEYTHGGVTRKYSYKHKSVAAFGNGPAETKNLLHGMINMFAIANLGMMCHFAAPPINKELRLPKDMSKVIHIGIMGIVVPIYLIVGLLGYFFLGDKLQTSDGNVLDILSDWKAGQAARCIMACAVLLKMPLYFNSTREAIRTELGIKDSFLMNVIITTLIAGIAYLLAIFVNLDTISEFTGATTGTLLGYVFPGLCLLQFVKSENKFLPEANERWLLIKSWFYVVFGGISGLLCLGGVVWTLVCAGEGATCAT